MQIKFLLFSQLFTLLFGLKVRQNAGVSSSVSVASLNGTWQSGDYDNMPSNALVVGYQFGGESIYLGRANYSSQLVFGKYRQALGGVGIGVMNREVVLTNYELLTSINAYWNYTTYTNDASQFQHAIIGSYDTSNEPIYIGRVHYMGALFPVMVRHKVGHLGYGGRQLLFKTYELLLRPQTIWKPVNFTTNSIPINATYYKTRDGTKVYIAQISYKKNRLVGQLQQGQKHCSFGFASRGFNSTNCELLISGNYTWHKDKFGVISPNSVVGGHTANLEVIYICRGLYNGEWVVGKIRPTFSGCDIAPMGRKQVRVHEYEMLVNK